MSRGAHTPYEENHRLNENGELEKKCTRHEIYFPEESPWLNCTDKYFYVNSKNKTDGLHPWCKRCSVKSSQIINQEKHEELLPYWREYYFLHKPHKRDINRAWCQDVENGRTEYMIEYRKTDAFKTSVKNSQEFRKLHKSHYITNQEWLNCKQYFGNACAYCGLLLEDHYRIYRGKLQKIDFHKEHYVNNGSNDLSNCLPSCGDCNNLKKKIDFGEWYIPDNPIFSQERLVKINKWLQEDYKQYAEEKPPYRIIKSKNEDNNKFHHELWSIDQDYKMIHMITSKIKKKDLEQDIKNYLILLKSTVIRKKGANTMADMTMCENENCPLRSDCYRVQCTPNPLWQSYSFYVYDETKGCEDYIQYW